ncbi:MAG: phage regulatory protein/antirepressor Ant [Candidatus Devosia phytovorans]|uniref:Phage regulatory protein/antirepressor Ant n=1 Tax=Candidatus Devosia phytovorans TaxID=3121372 RepID=A0AAJ5VX18_9HYPH|nr:phage regulatory protein/antirepressor Ant [Devosia sp.]WEK05770.1 MAG: phage regulatory protein/antirepressor Ant [Devosia sp.]
MNELLNTTASAVLTMTTREIAALVDKEHRNVLRDARTMLAALDLAEEGYAQFWADPQNGQKYVELALPRDLTMTLVTGYSIPLRKKVIDRLDELERGAAQPAAIDFSDPAVLLGVVGHLQGQVTEKDHIIASMLPSVEALEQIAETHGSMNRTEAAKHLGVPPQVLCKWMRTHMWTYRRAGAKDDLAYQAKINAGYLEHKVTTGPRPDGTEWIGTQVRVTPRGLTVLAKAFPKAAEPAVAAALRQHLARVA